jgi:hypothetical protein
MAQQIRGEVIGGSAMLAPVTHILPITLIRRERNLQVPGRVLVRKGQKVAATDAIAEAQLYPENILIDVSRALRLSAEQADRYITCQAGEQIAEGDVVAGPVGLAQRMVRSPRNGQVILAGSGQVLIQVDSKLFQLKAGFSGEVVELNADRGAIIEATGALIQGVWGNGQIDAALLSVLAKSPDDVLKTDQLDVSLRGSIVFAGHCEAPEVLKTAEDLPLHGLILSSMSTSLVSLAKHLNIPLILIEGFGHRPMNPVAFKLLSTSERREVDLNAEAWDAHIGTRPEIVIPLPGSGALAQPRDTGVFAPDQQVRVLRAPHTGAVGNLVSLIETFVFPNGLSAPAAEIRLESGKSVVIPLANLEILA